jgi:hypothetical protein
VVYVDVDPVAVTHARQMLAGNDRATAIGADLRRPADLLDQLAEPDNRAVLDLDRPVGLLLVSMLHFVPGDETYQAVATLRDSLAPGSYIVISHPISEAIDERAATQVQGVYQRTTTPGGLRDRAGVRRFFDGFALVPPGLVWMTEWQPEDGADEPAPPDARRFAMLAGVGRKPN